MNIAVDGMGGDFAPIEIVKGCVQASELIGREDKIFIVGIEDVIKKELKKYKFNHSKIKIVGATEVITNEDAPVKAARAKKDSSMIKGLSLVKDGTCDFFISAGNTGALMAGSLFRLGRIPGVERPVIGMIYPIIGGDVSFLVDAGANAECKPKHLLQFARMGCIYMEKVLGVENPSVGLINIGAEEKKGTEMLRDTYKLLKESELNFVGNIEGRDIPYGAARVLVCDGFVGNTVLKLTEGLAQRMMEQLKSILGKDMKTKMGALMLMNEFKSLKAMMDYSEYGGAPILGVKGEVVKIHGSSNAGAVKNAIVKGFPYVGNNVVGIISDAAEARAKEKEADPEELTDAE